MKKVLLISLGTIFALISIVAIIFVVYFNSITQDIELDIAKLEEAKVSLFLDDSNNFINEDSNLALNDIPKDLINAFISIEDKRFYKHNGIDVKRIISASFYNLTHGKHAQGASTITQQLIKNTHLNSNKTIDRKLKEIKLALELEKTLSKDEILEKYLNSLYFGNGIYGVKDAAKNIFDKDIGELTVSECAVLAGIIKAPRYYSPLQNKEKSKTRRNIVLESMLDNKYIDEKTYNLAKNSEIIINNQSIHSNIWQTYVKQALLEASQILNMSPIEVMNGNYQIATYYSPQLQNKLTSIYKNLETEVMNYDNLSIISDNSIAGIQAIFSNNDVDIYRTRRQVGSVIKPIAVYLPALDDGLIHLASLINDEKINIDGYAPSNYNNYYRGKIAIRDAVKFSSNSVAVQVLNKLSIARSKSYLSQMNINISDNGLSVALGGLNDGLTPLELINSYETIANQGVFNTNSCIKHIIDSSGKVIYRHTKENKRVFNESSCYLMTDALIETAKSGTAKKLKYIPYNIASKTGTVANPNDVNSNIGAYNMSYTSENTILTYIGGVIPTNIQGGGLPTIITREIYNNMDAPQNDFIKPDGVQKMKFDKKNYENDGKIVLSNRENTYSDLFDVRYLPEDRLLEENNIEYIYSAGELTIKNIYSSNIKIYSSNLFGQKQLKNEIVSCHDCEIIPIKPSLFEHYIVEIWKGEKLLKSLIIR